MDIEHVTAVDDELVSALARLIPQLTADAPLPGRAELAAMVASPGTVLLVARDPEIVGTLTLTLFRIPTGMQAQINCVVVDAAARGRGVGEALTRAAMERARAAGASRIQLTSRHGRDAAHRMYHRMGFQLASTNVFRLDAPRKPA
jgi:ribosomal protein S18 acetylase RimI-like enzyme